MSPKSPKSWKSKFLLLGGIATFFVYALLPQSYAIFSVLIPLFCLCFSLVNSRDYFNFPLAIGLMFLLIFIPSSWMMFDANLDAFFAFKNSFVSGFDIVANIVLFGAPAFLIGFGIYSLVATNATSGVSALLKGLGILAFTICMVGILDYVNLLPEWGLSFWPVLLAIFDFITDFIVGITNIIGALIGAISDYVSLAISDATLVSQNKLSLFGWIWNRLKGIFELIWNFIKDDIIEGISNIESVEEKAAENASLMSNPVTATAVLGQCAISGGSTCGLLDVTQSQGYLITVARGFPIILAILCFIFAGAFRWNSHFQKDLDRISKATDDEFFFEFRAKYDFGILGQLLITLVVSFFIYLSMNSGGFTDPTFFGVYLVVITVCTFVILFQLIPARMDTFKNFVFGTILGGLGIFLFSNLATSGRLDVLESNEITSQPSKLFSTLTTIFYTSPAETLLFQVALPGFALLIIYSIYKNRAESKYHENLLKQIALREAELIQLQTKYQHALDMNRKNASLDRLRVQIFNLENDIALLKKQEQAKMKRVELFTLMSSSSGALILTILFVFILPSFLFSALHVVKSGSNLFDFFNFGPGFILMSCGAWITFIALRFGYNAAMCCHSVNNLFIILLVSGLI